jgi:hypothetical protein
LKVTVITGVWTDADLFVKTLYIYQQEQNVLMIWNRLTSDTFSTAALVHPMSTSSLFLTVLNGRPNPLLESVCPPSNDLVTTSLTCILSCSSLSFIFLTTWSCYSRWSGYGLHFSTFWVYFSRDHWSPFLLLLYGSPLSRVDSIWCPSPHLTKTFLCFPNEKGQKINFNFFRTDKLDCVGTCTLWFFQQLSRSVHVNNPPKKGGPRSTNFIKTRILITPTTMYIIINQ